MKFGLKETTVQSICQVFSCFPQVEKAVLYGSRAKGTFKNGSDIDLTLFGSDDLTLQVMYRILDQLDDLLLPYSIDLSLFRDIGDPDVIEHIQRVGVPFYTRDVAGQMYTCALTRDIPLSFSQATVGSPSPEPIKVDLARTQHRSYKEALQLLGLKLHEHPPMERFPDCCFVEDCAVLLGTRAVVTNPGTPSRVGEEESLIPFLSARFEVHRMPHPATLDGGDCLRIGRTLYVGASGRTNAEGIRFLSDTAHPLGLEVVPVPVRDALHLKCVCSSLGPERVLLAEGFLPDDLFRGLEITHVPREEAYAANCVAFNGSAIISAGYPRTRELIEKAGFKTYPIDVSEIRKADGSLTCLSILF